MTKQKPPPVSIEDLVFELGWAIDIIHSCCLVGDAAPKVQARYHLLTRPRVGDLVLITHAPGHAINRYGTLLSAGVEVLYPNEPQEEGEEPHQAMVWTIKTADGRTMRWHNVEVLRASWSWEEEDDALEAVGYGHLRMRSRT